MSKPRAKRSDEPRVDYDFSNGVRGKYAERVAEGCNVVVLDPDVASLFPDSVAVNEALRLFLPGGRARALLPSTARRRAQRSKG